ncbi:hypothetical protein PYW08_012366 [Mythimna loreyi]|uniref:Uncharacterized protein n=1 Tax=Mythimna loreyi TaxID=667449 RepID=A0ACC2Q3J7_9NEOP|nr:hypothetical protein PYW08_012366 [Mythimna loreyi]
MIAFSTLLQLLGLTPVLAMNPVTKDLLTPIPEYGEGCGYMSCPVMGQNVLNVHIVPATHAELGYTRTFYEHFTGYEPGFDHSVVNMKNILDSVITALWTNEKRKFTFSDMPYLFYWWKNRDLSVKRMVYQLLRQGRLFFVGGGWSMSDEATTSYHAIIDHFTYSLRKINATFLECGRPLVTWQADVFGHSKEFASLMAQMGFDGHFINPISFDDELNRMKTRSLEFVWRGSDDLGSNTDIYTHKLFDGYWSPPGFCFGSFCNDPLIITSDSTFSNVEERVESFMQQMLKRQSPYYTTKNVMVMMGQRYGYFDAGVWFANVDKLIMRVNSNQRSQKNKVYLFYSTPACYLRAVHEASPKLATKQDDFYPFTYDKDTHGSGAFTSRPIMKYIAREIHLFTQIAKHLQVFAKLGDNDGKFEEIMWIQGVLQDHTIISGSSRQHVIEYYAKKFILAKQLCLQIYRQGFNNLRDSSNKMIYYACPFNMSSCWNIQGDRFFTVIYNPLAWPVTIPVRLPVARGIYTVYDPKGVKQNHSIVTIPDLVQMLPGRGEFQTEDELVFIAPQVPPMGYRSYYVERVQIRTRYRRSIIKKMNKNSKKKKYLTRQTNNLKIDDKSLLDDLPEYEYFEDTSENPSKQVLNTSKARELELYSDFMATLPPVASFTTEDQIFAQKNWLPSTSMTSPSRTTTTTTSTSTTTSPPPSTPTRSTSTPSPTVATTQKAKPKRKPTPATYIEYYYDDSEPVSSTAPYFDFEKFYRRMERSGYHSSLSNDNFIRNEYIQVNLDAERKFLSIALSNGVTISFNAQLCYYVSDDPERLDSGKKQPGAYIFRPIDPHPVLIADFYDIKVLKSDIVEEIQIRFSNYAGISLRLYKGFPTIELDWIVGPIPDADGLGKEVFIRYLTDLQNEGVFYTDSNGRQTIKRIRDSRATYTPVLDTGESGISSNIYPVTSKIYVEDLQKNIRLSIFIDRAQGGTSLVDGTIDLMLHRRIFTDDTGIRAWLNETEYGKGIIVRGKHHLYLTKADYRPNRVFEKKFAKELELSPTVFTSLHKSYYNITYDEWFKEKNEYTALNMKLPVGVHILTLEKWHDKLLLRLENYLEKSDVVRSGFKRVFIQELFKDFRIIGAKETTLSANIWLQDRLPLSWRTDKFVKSFNEFYGNHSDIEFSADQGGFTKPTPVFFFNEGIELKPQEIRTFVLTYVRR